MATTSPDVEARIRALRDDATKAATGAAIDGVRSPLLNAEVAFVDKQLTEIKGLLDAYEKGYWKLSSDFDETLRAAIRQEQEVGKLLDDAATAAANPTPAVGQGAGQVGQGTAAPDPHAHPHPTPTHPSDCARKSIQRKVRQLGGDLLKADHDITDPTSGAEVGYYAAFSGYDGTKHGAELGTAQLELFKAATKIWDDRIKAWLALRDKIDKARNTGQLDVAYVYATSLLSRLASKANKFDPSVPASAAPDGWAAATKWLTETDGSGTPAQQCPAPPPPPATLYVPVGSAKLADWIGGQLVAVIDARLKVLEDRVKSDQAFIKLTDARKVLDDYKTNGIGRILQSLKPLPLPKP